MTLNFAQPKLMLQSFYVAFPTIRKFKSIENCRKFAMINLSGHKYNNIKYPLYFLISMNLLAERKLNIMNQNNVSRS